MILNFANRDAAKTAWHARLNNRSIKDIKAEAAKIEVRNAAGPVAEILIYEEIGYYGISAKQFATVLAGITAPTINVRINSPGGDVFDGLAIYAALKAHPAKINTQVDGLAASAASFIMLAGDTVAMAENAFAMIHRAWGLAIGNALDMRALAETLDKIDGQLAEMYSKKTGKGKDAMLALMDAETWFTAEEAVTAGLVDAVNGKAVDEAVDAAAGADASMTPHIAQMRRRLSLAHHTD